MTSPIVWQDEESNTILIDVPRSIAAAQGTADAACNDTLLSCKALQTPYPSNEPKSEKARAKLRTNTVDAALHAEYRDLLVDALQRAKEHHTGQWCFPRRYTTDTSEASSGKRKANDEAIPDRELPHRFLADALSMRGSTFERKVRQNSDTKGTIAQGMRPSGLYWSYSSVALPIRIRVEDKNESHFFRMPPGSAVCLGDCVTTIEELHNCVQQMTWVTEPKGQFDFVLLDPPWPNRSVKRTHKTPGSSYSTLTTLEDVQNLLTNMKLDMVMSDECLVGIWITNKPAVRDLVLGEDGTFDLWGLELVEEWIWLKTTTLGEPVTPLDAFWRKPYEVLLLGRKRSYGSTEPGSDQNKVRRRVLMSVPDLHSRKPCLKTLIEPLMPRARYRALEVFARHLVADWWSWGNEVLKFNWNGYWSEHEWWTRAIDELQRQ